MRILYDPYYTTLSYCSRNLPLSKLQSGLNKLVLDTWDMMLALSGGTKVPVCIPEGMSEDVRCTDMGHSFLKSITTTPLNLALLKEMLKLHTFTLFQLGEARSDRNWEVDPASAQEFFHTIKPLIESITFLVQVTGSGPLCMLEIVGDRYCNGSRKRNLYISHGRVFLLRMDLKTSSACGIRSHVVHYPPPKVLELLVYYLSVVQPLETFLAGHLGWTNQHVAYSQFIYVVKGSVITPQAFSDIIATYTDRYFNCRISGLDLRHVLKNIQETFLPPPSIPPSRSLETLRQVTALELQNRCMAKELTTFQV